MVSPPGVLNDRREAAERYQPANLVPCDTG
jgi:hypothetical protein